jgi:S-adenosylmethionine:tRNA ribosyltransferase-isomerase
MLLADFDYHLPEELIAKHPSADRGASRMLVVDRQAGSWEDRYFRDLPHYISPGDCLVLNDSRVIPARLYGHREGLTGHVEVLLERAISADHKTWRALARPGRKLRSGDRIRFSEDLSATILGRGPYGERTIHFEYPGDIYEALERVGHMPLPPYMNRPDAPEDRVRYQTIYAADPGSVAAPTAGLHFTEQILQQCHAAGASVARVTLHVGLGTFQPLHTIEVEDAKLHSEAYRITPDNAALIRAARRRIAVGTTSVRTLETAAREDFKHLSGDTDIFIYPGYTFRATGAMVTNFHLPQSSLLLLVCAFAGRELALEAYHHAVKEQYRFYSYGDCMLIL